MSAGDGALHVLFLPSWYVTPVVPWKGVYFREQAQAVRAAGAQVGVIYPELRSIRSLTEGALGANRCQTCWRDDDGLPTLCWYGWAPPKLERLKPRLFVHQASRLFERYVARCGKPDLIHAHSVRWAGGAAHAIKRRFGIPYLLSEHASAYARGVFLPWQETWVRAIAEDASAVFAVSRALAAQMSRAVGTVPIEVLPNMVDTAFFCPPPSARRAPPLRFVAIGALIPLKGIDVLLRAFAQAFAAQPGVELEIGGDGPARGALEQLARQLGLADRVRFLGHLSREQVRAAFWRAHCFVLASLVETFSVVLIEALATGLPVVATRCGGPEDIVTEDLGALVPPGDPTALAAALVASAEAHYDPRRLRGSAEQRYGRDAIAARLLASYRAALT